MRRTAPLILGGGPAGAAAALRLAAAGERPVVLERSREPVDSLCGGFVSWRTLDKLKRIGIDTTRLGSSDIHRVRLFHRASQVEAALPRPAKAVSRRLFDTVLLGAAEQAGAGVERGVTVRSIAKRRLHLADGGVLCPDTLFLASGKHDVRGTSRPADARGTDPTIGLRTRFGPAPGLARLIGDAIELHLFDRGYAGLVLQEDGSANLCLAVRRSRLTAAGTPQALFNDIADECPALAERMAWRDSSSPQDAVANVPYGWRCGETGPGLFRLGDQAGVIPSLAGEGIGIAIASGIAASDAWRHGGADAAAGYQRAFSRALALPMGIAGLLWRMGENRRAAPVLLAAAALPGALASAGRLTRIK
ncbi:FAD-dependent monooxygenase [Stakelama sp. CBK3Z-3]|uniref:FAD-dependent monooxygenase n=1 Tax=Stakelama flava TaxID=2860338 RepID=A0ABS6XKK9_9SPHN|nr:FAD-dependent monooxygenase [Stakelama flava]MBW4330742.1 FAD-dependent monooxygenase [Stakelama flava]